MIGPRLFRLRRKIFILSSIILAGSAPRSPRPTSTAPTMLARSAVLGVEFAMRNWPSIIPGTPEDFYIVLNNYGRFGTAFAETDLDRANYETTIADLIAGQHSDPLRVIMFNPETNRSEDVSHAVAQEILRRLGLEDRGVPSVLEDFIDRHVGSDRQLTLRLAVA